MTAAPARRALITGAANGLGEALTGALTAAGWQVVAVDREDPAETPGEGVIPVTCDLSDRGAVDALLADLAHQPGFDLVILNAAVSATGKFETIPLTVHHQLIRLNTETPMVMAAGHAAMGKLNANGHLTFISSLSHFTGYPGGASYAATKDAIAVYARSIRKPFAKRGISVSCVFPGPMRTAQADRHSPAGADAQKRMTPQEAANHVLKGIFSGKAKIIPGNGPKLFAFFGRLAPWASDRAMRKIIHEKLDRDVY